RKGQRSPETDPARPSAKDRDVPGRGPLLFARVLRGRGPRRGRTRVDCPGNHTTARGVYGYRDAPGVSGTTYHRGTGLSLDQESRGHQPGMAGETRTDCGVGDAHRRGLTCL